MGMYGADDITSCMDKGCKICAEIYEDIDGHDVISFSEMCSVCNEEDSGCKSMCELTSCGIENCEICFDEDEEIL